MGLLNSFRQRLSRNAEKTPVPAAVKRRGELAYSFFQQRDYLAARELLLKALEQRKEIRDVAFLNWLLGLLWWTWTVTDQYREPTEYFSQYLQLYPSDADAYALRAASLWYSGQLQEAIVDYSKALELDPKHILAHLGRGQVLAECEEFSHAIEDLDFVHENLERNAIEDVSWRTQVQAYAFSGRAFAHAGLGDLERAWSEFDRSIFLCPDNAFVYFYRATVHENQSHITEAVADYEMSLRKTMPKLTVLKRKYAEVKVRTLT